MTHLSPAALCASLFYLEVLNIHKIFLPKISPNQARNVYEFKWIKSLLPPSLKQGNLKQKWNRYEVDKNSSLWFVGIDGIVENDPIDSQFLNNDTAQKTAHLVTFTEEIVNPF